jgi:hypothetical protein
MTTSNSYALSKIEKKIEKDKDLTYHLGQVLTTLNKLQ